MSSYWHRTLEKRISRRRALAAGGALGLSAASIALLACGSDDKSTPAATGPAASSGSVTGGASTGAAATGGSGAQERPSLLAQPVDSLSRAKRGGTFRYFSNVEMPNMDPIVAAASGFLRNRVYQKMIKPEAGYFEAAKVGAVVADAVEGWESTGDKLIFKLKPNNYFDPRPPTNGRVVKADDVLFGFERVESDSGRRVDLFQSANPDAPIVKYSDPDDLTVVLDLAYPDFGLLANLGTQNSGFPADILPREGESADVNIRSDPRGSGPYYISRYEPSARIEFDRNPGYTSDQHFFDRIELPIITEYATRLAQFKAGALFHMPVNAIDILPTKRAVPALNLYEAEVVTTNTTRVKWGWLETSQFRDERVRQAFALSIDRGLFIDALYNVSQFEDEGLSVEVRYNSSSIPGSYDGYWLDPLSAEFGENSKYFQHNIAEAKALLSAAGFPDGIKTTAAHDGGGRSDTRPMETIIGMVRDAGFDLTLKPIDNRSEFTAVYTFDGRGKYDGIAFGGGTSGADPGNQLYAIYHSRGSIFPGYDVRGTSDGGGDPKIDELTNKIRQTFSIEERWTLAHELQRYEAAKQYDPLFPGGTRGFNLAWPALANFGTYRAGQWDAIEPTWWIDQTQPPLA